MHRRSVSRRFAPGFLLSTPTSFWIVTILLVATVRLFLLSADPPTIVLTDHLTDEGWYTQNARNNYLFGAWIMDEHNPALVLTPFFTLAQRVVIGLFGVSFASVRLPSALSALLVVFLVILRLRKYREWLLVASALVVLNPLLVAYSRVAFVESLQWGALACMWFFVTDRRQSAWTYGLAGAAAAFAVAAKPTAGLVAVGIALLPWLRPGVFPFRRRVWLTTSYGIGGILGLAPFALFVAKFPQVFRIELARESTLASVQKGFDGIAAPLLLGLRPVGAGFEPLAAYWVVVAPMLVIAAVRLAQIGPERQAPDVDSMTDRRLMVSASWLWLGLAVLTLAVQAHVQFRPRHWINLLVPASILLASPPWRAAAHRVSPIGLVAAACALSLTLRPFLIDAVECALGRSNTPTAMLLLLFLVATGTGLFYLVLRRLAPIQIVGSNRVSAAINRIPVLCVGAFWGTYLVLMLTTSTFTIRDTSTELQNALPEGAVLTGAVANTMALETNFFAYETRDLARMGMGEGHLNADPAPYGTTHVVTTMLEPPDSLPTIVGDRGRRPPEMPFTSGYRLVFTSFLVPLHSRDESFRYYMEVHAIEPRP